MTRRSFVAGLALAGSRPNILFVISDDQSWLHTGSAFQRLASEGALFTHAFCVAPSCAPSRASILTGQPIWRLREGANMRAHLPAEFPTYTRLLAQAGYHVGHAGKGYGPVEPGAKEQNPAGAAYPSFDAFLEARPAGAPFCFWHGSGRPHRPYKKGQGNKPLEVPAFLPDAPAVRQDLSDYAFAIDRFDDELAALLRRLDAAGEAGNTLVVVTSDNGMSFPRGKTNLYDAGTRMPLAVRWPGRTRPGRVSEELVSFIDFAPAFLEAAGIKPPPAMIGRNFLAGTGRAAVYLGRERHSPSRERALGYPMRAVRTRDYLYIRNLRPERAPAGDPPGSADVDPSPTLAYMLREKPAPYYHLAFGLRPAAELYDVRKDPWQMKNLAADPAYAGIEQRLASDLDEHLRKTGDPRAAGSGDVFDRYPFWGQGRRNE